MAGSTAFRPDTIIPTTGSARSFVEVLLRVVWRTCLVLLTGLVLLLAWLAMSGELYRQDSDLAYYLGLTGGSLMLALLLYPLRKRVHAFERLGRMEHWFRFHVLAGIGGPVLVLFHCLFQTASMNGAVALYAMLLVVSSGLVGRYLYRHVHKGLAGRQLTLQEAREHLDASLQGLAEVFPGMPDLESRLLAFQIEASKPIDRVSGRVWRFLTLKARSRRLARRIARDAREDRRLARERPDARREGDAAHALRLVRGFLDAAVDLSQIAIWERLFSLWHVIHLPFLYLLLFSGIVHVVAVHMY